MKKYIAAVLICAFICGFPARIIYTENSDSLIEKIIKHIDELYRSRSSMSTIEMQIATLHWERSLRMDIWTIGMDKTFIKILSPKKEKGVATLRIKNEMWNFLPKANKVIK
ncbi:MAG: outer membrane lipoprotein-sorting protein, partial [bacterium]